MSYDDITISPPTIEEKMNYLGFATKNELAISKCLKIASAESRTLGDYIEALKVRSVNLIIFNLLSAIGFTLVYMDNRILLTNHLILDLSMMLFMTSIMVTTYAMYHSGVYRLYMDRNSRHNLSLCKDDSEISIYILYSIVIANEKNVESYKFSKLMVFVGWLAFLSNMIINFVYIVLFN